MRSSALVDTTEVESDVVDDDDRPAIAHVITRFARGGSERRLLDAVSALPEFQHDVILGRDSYAPALAEVHGLHRIFWVESLVREISPTQDVRALRDVLRILRSGQYSAVHTHQSKAGVIGRLAARLVCIPHIFHSLSMAIYDGSSGAHLYGLLERWLSTRTTAVTVVGTDLCDQAASVGVDRKKLHVVRSSQDVDKFLSARAGRVLARRAYGISPGEVVVGYVGSLEARKNVTVLPEFADRLAGALGEHVLLLIAGDGAERHRMEGTAQRAPGVSVQFLGHVDEIEKVFAAIDCLVLLSETEGLPQVLLQAAMVGIPFVATDACGAREAATRSTASYVGTLDRLDELVQAAAALIRGRSQQPAADPSSFDEWRGTQVHEQYRSIYARAGLLPRASNLTH